MLFIICVVVSAALAGTNLLTQDRIAQLAAENAEASRKIVLPAAEAFESPGGRGLLHRHRRRPDWWAMCLRQRPAAMAATVSVMTGIDAEGNITGVVILSHDETPGLGANAEKPDFLNQYLQPAPEGGLSRSSSTRRPAEGQIEAMTGATVTSTAVTNAVNQAIEQYYEVKGGA